LVDQFGGQDEVAMLAHADSGRLTVATA
jgi:hypothetical protein